MSDQQQTPPPRVIEGNVRATAGPASVAVNKPARHYVREVTHFRVVGEDRHTLVEMVPELGDLPPTYDGCRFWGVGHLVANTDIGEFRRTFHFKLRSETLGGAWALFDECMQVAVREEEPRLREDYRNHLRELAKQRQQGLVAVQGQSAAGQVLAHTTPVLRRT